MLATAASAGQAFDETIHEEDTLVLEDFCDIPGLTVELAFVLDIARRVAVDFWDQPGALVDRSELVRVFSSP